MLSISFTNKTFSKSSVFEGHVITKIPELHGFNDVLWSINANATLAKVDGWLTSQDKSSHDPNLETLKNSPGAKLPAFSATVAR